MRASSIEVVEGEILSDKVVLPFATTSANCCHQDSLADHLSSDFQFIKIAFISPLQTSTSEYNGSARPFRWICVNTKRSTVANHDDVPKHSSISGIPHIPSWCCSCSGIANIEHDVRNPHEPHARSVDCPFYPSRPLPVNIFIFNPWNES